MITKEELAKMIDKRSAEFDEIANAVWETPELCFHEYNSTKVQREFMEKEGFRIQTPVAGMETAFIAEYGSGKPVIAILGENDALAGLSQKADIPHPEPLVQDGNGHGCGHNLLGTGAMEAVTALKEAMEKTGQQGTIRYIYTPAEEGGGGKTFMARSGVFDDVDIALAWHPSNENNLDNAGLACVNFDLSFHGKAAHAAAAPWDGRSALDAAELMNMGVQFLREHVTPDVRIHYAFLNAGGSACNITHPFVKMRYCVRAKKSDTMEAVFRRVIKVAKGAAMMTETTVDEPAIFGAYKDFIPNMTLNRVVLDNLNAFTPIPYTKEEEDYARQFVPYGTQPDAKEPISTGVDQSLDRPAAGSTDVADVSYCVPICQLKVATAAAGTPIHSWMMTAQGKSSIAHKGMHTAAKVLAASVLDLWADPDLITKAKAEQQERTGGKKYTTIVPDSFTPEDYEC